MYFLCVPKSTSEKARPSPPGKCLRALSAGNRLEEPATQTARLRRWLLLVTLGSALNGNPTRKLCTLARISMSRCSMSSHKPKWWIYGFTRKVALRVSWCWMTSRTLPQTAHIDFKTKTNLMCTCCWPWMLSESTSSKKVPSFIWKTWRKGMRLEKSTYLLFYLLFLPGWPQETLNLSSSAIQNSIALWPSHILSCTSQMEKASWGCCLLCKYGICIDNWYAVKYMYSVNNAMHLMQGVGTLGIHHHILCYIILYYII